MSSAVPLQNIAAKSPIVSKPPHAGLLLQRKCACGGSAASSLTGKCEACKSERLQTKLSIGASNDPLEQEADQVADQVLAAALHSPVSGIPPRIQRDSGQATEGTDTAPASVEHVLASSGRPLEPVLRQDMEQRFGHDFSGVRVHSGSAAAQSARELNAPAYTAGRDIVFDSGKFAPSTNDGRRLLAHELTHVVQQRGQQVAAQMKLAVSTPGEAGEREADAAADAVMQGRSVPSIAHGFTSIQRKCYSAGLGTPKPDCTPSERGIVGWQFQFKVGCDDLLSGEEAKISKLKVGSELMIHGFASQEGDAGFSRDLSCYRANRIADIARKLRADCPVIGIFKHGEPSRAVPPDFWRSVIIQEITPSLESGELGLDPTSSISRSWALYRRAKVDPTRPNLTLVSAWRSEVKDWLKSIGKTLAPQGAKLTRRNLDDYRRIYASAEQLWIAIDELLALHKYPDAAKETYTGWAVGEGKDQSKKFKTHIENVPTTAKYHVDIFGEGYFKGAINIGMAERTSSTGISNSRVPNLIYRKFSAKDATLPIADHAADLVTSESGPIGIPGLAEEIARIIAPGGTIVLRNPIKQEADHDKVAKAVGGTIKKVYIDQESGRKIETWIVVPGP
ncbi:eCIS core domain-containing protein [Candidatus Nitrotoga sp. 1052]|uniref:eCIS core domain-containing protein n=1 Tax=Candidatus Nitrotoga sp. 1052 TaxID=2886964 RepID=UPI001EF6C9E4|nr:DUF4157 domain-containing protein [Candidatus Nitrotoga sp. 1052]CAH1087684.1 conserved hypothetical protein [Candidatus Nitrotoga sp. 1052]